MQLKRHLTSKHEALFEKYPLTEMDVMAYDGAFSNASPVIVPTSWPKASLEALTQFFAENVVPEIENKKQETDIPTWLSPASRDLPFDGERLHGHIRRENETSIEQLLHRIAGYLTYLALQKEIIEEDEARIFYDELQASILEQKIIPQSSVLKQLGLEWAYGVPQPSIDGPAPVGRINLGAQGGHKIGLHELSKLRQTKDLAKDFERQSRSEIGFAPSATKLYLDIDHPHAADFVDWKLSAAQKKAAFKASLELARSHIEEIMTAVREESDLGHFERFNEDCNHPLKSACQLARASMLPENIIQAAIKAEQTGQEAEEILALLKAELDSDQDIETVTGALCLPDQFMQNILEDDENIHASRLWDNVTHAIWSCGHPTLLFKDHIAKTHIAPASGDIGAGSASSAHLFLDHSGQAGATLNLIQFIDPETRKLNVESLLHCCKIWTIALDLIIDCLGVENPVAIRTIQEHRPIALSYHNLAPTLMALGLAYDSDAGRATASVITALISGAAHSCSADLAAKLEAFPAWYRNQEASMDVIKQYRLNVARPRQNQQTTVTAALLQECPEIELVQTARQLWDDVYLKTRETGLRNAQLVSLDNDRLSQLLLNCATLNCDGDSLPYQEILTEEGWEKNIHPHIGLALQNLGYSSLEMAAICSHAIGYRSLKHAPEINHASLKEFGFTDELLERIDNHLAEASNLRHIFTPWIIGKDFLIDTLNVDPDLVEDYSFDLLNWLGFSELQITEATRWVCGTGTLAEAPHLQKAHLNVFVPALSEATSDQENTLCAMAQIDMMAAIQPFVSGGIAHDLYLSGDCKIEDIQELITAAWQKELKVLNLSRLPQNQFQPIFTPDIRDDRMMGTPISEIELNLIEEVAPLPETIQEVAADHSSDRTRKKLPFRRKGYTQKATIGGHRIYLRTGEYQDGSLGEIFLDMHKEGASFRSLLNNFAMAISIGLQYGVPLEEYVDAFTFTRFDPSGKVDGNDAIKMSTSVLDYIFRELAVSYLGRDDLAHATPADLLPGTVGRTKEEQELPEEASKIAQSTLSNLQDLASKGYIRSKLSQTQSLTPSSQEEADNFEPAPFFEEGVTTASTEALLKRIEERRKELSNTAPPLYSSDSEDDLEEEIVNNPAPEINFEDALQNLAEEMHARDPETSLELSSAGKVGAGRDAFDNFAGLVNRRLEDIKKAKHHGYNGGQCPRCGSMSLLQAGHISMCDCCGKVKLHQ